MISVTRTVTTEIDERDLFDTVRYTLQDEYIDDTSTISDLPKDTQRLIFAKVGAMMVNYAWSEDFEG